MKAAVVGALITGIFGIFYLWYADRLERIRDEEKAKTEATKTVADTDEQAKSTVEEPLEESRPEPALPQKGAENGSNSPISQPTDSKKEPETRPEPPIVDPSASGDAALLFAGKEAGLEAVVKSFLKSKSLDANTGWAISKAAAADRFASLAAAKKALGSQFRCLVLAKPSVAITGQPPLFTASGSLELEVFDFRKNDAEPHFLSGLSAAGGSAEKALKNFEPVLRHALESKKIDLRQCAD